MVFLYPVKPVFGYGQVWTRHLRETISSRRRLPGRPLFSSLPHYAETSGVIY